jgi:hypothetical protein
MHGTIPTEDDQRTLLKAGNFVDSRFHMILQEKIKDSPLRRRQNIIFTSMLRCWLVGSYSSIRRETHRVGD